MFSMWLSHTIVEMVGIVVAKFTKSLESPNCKIATFDTVRNMVISYPFYFHFYFYIYFKTFSLFLGNVICLETVLQLFMNHCFIQNCYAKLATERKLRGVSTYLPILEALCSKRVWNTRSATTISSLRPRPSGGQEYIPMSLFDS